MGDPPRLVDRVAALIARPSSAWGAIATEAESDASIMRRHAAPLAAIPAICGLAGPLLFTFAIANVRVRPNVAALLIEAAAAYVLTLAGVWLVGIWIDLIAPGFGSRRGQGLKLAAYAPTASWMAGLFALYPPIGLPVGILAAAWSLRVLYLGLSPLTGTPDESRLTYFAAILVGVAVVAVAVALVVGRAAEFGGPLAIG